MRMRSLSVLLVAFMVLPVNVFAGVFDIIPTFFSSSAQAYTKYLGVSENVQTMELLSSSNNTDPNIPVGGGGISIIDGTVLTSAAGPVADGEDVTYDDSDQISVYVVKEGDSLSQIANMFDVSSNTIAWANELGKERVIQPGQKLVILPVTGVSYTVEKGDTIASIAKKFGGDEEEIRRYNSIYKELVIGMDVIIPGGEEQMSSPSSSPGYHAPSHYVAVPSNAPTYQGFYEHPLPNGIKTQGLHGRNALDFGAPIGTPILAAASGSVIISKSGGWNGGYGSYIVVKHNNGTQTLYSHNSSNAVGVGQSVVQGQVIGYVGSTGRSTGPHLHFEVRGAENPF